MKVSQENIIYILYNICDNSHKLHVKPDADCDTPDADCNKSASPAADCNNVDTSSVYKLPISKRYTRDVSYRYLSDIHAMYKLPKNKLSYRVTSL